MIDPGSGGAWVTFAIDRLIVLLTSPVFASAVLVVLFRRALGTAIGTVRDRLFENGGKVSVGPTGLSVDLNEAGRTLGAEAQALEKAAPPVGLADADELRRLREKIEGAQNDVVAIQRALESPVARSVDVLAHRIAERARLIVEGGQGLRGQVLHVLAQTSNGGGSVPYIFRIHGAGNIALAILLVDSRPARGGDFGGLELPVWAHAARILNEGGIGTDMPPFSDEFWRIMSSADPLMTSYRFE